MTNLIVADRTSHRFGRRDAPMSDLDATMRPVGTLERKRK